MKAFDKYRDGALILQRTIEELRWQVPTTGEAEDKLFNIFYRRILPVRLLAPVADAYFASEWHTTWALLNVCTSFAQKLPPGPNLKATVALGKFLGLGRNGHAPATTEA